MLERISEIVPKELDIPVGSFKSYLLSLLEETFEELEAEEGEGYEWAFRSDHKGGLMIKFWMDDYGFTKLLKNVTGEDYLMMYVTSGYYDSETSENYTEIEIYDMGKVILENTKRYLC